MHLLDLQLDAARLVRFAEAHGHNRAGDEDHGYTTHAWLKACFAQLAPKTHRLFERRDGGLRLLAYSQAGKSALHEHASIYSEPIATEVADWESLASKEMPATWRIDQRLGFEVRACPISRGEDGERDVFLRSVSRAGASNQSAPAREKVYREWFARQLDPAASILSFQLLGFRRIRALRRGHDSSGHASNYHAVERPDALFTGMLKVQDPQRFSALLERGIGRHRSFGFGMLLLRPPNTRSI